MLKNKLGITLIALIVTIIVLIILAGISINLLIGDNGIITRAKDVAIEQAVGQRKEAVNLAITTEYAKQEGDSSKMTVEGVLKELQTSQNSNKIYAMKGTTLITSTEGNTSLAGATFYFPEELNGSANTGIIVEVDSNLGVAAESSSEVEDAEEVAANIELTKANIETDVTWSNGVPTIIYNEKAGANVTLEYSVGNSETKTPLANTTGTITGANITLGTTVNIYAKTNGKYSDAVSVTVQDTTPPTIESFAVVTADTTQTSIKISVTASDNQSGLATSGRYTYYINNEIADTTKLSSGANPTNDTIVTYIGLTAGTEYTFKVVVTDAAENTTTSESIRETTTAIVSVQYEGLTQTETNRLASNNMSVLTVAQIEDIVDNTSGLSNERKTARKEALEDVTKVKAVLAGNIPLPKGYTYYEGTSTDVASVGSNGWGVVIRDANGNEWVWIPVPDVFGNKGMAIDVSNNPYTIRDSVTGKYYSKGCNNPGEEYNIENDYTVNCEPYIYTDVEYDLVELGINSLQDIVTDYDNMIESVDKYGGFYVGRYELSMNNNIPEVKKIKQVYECGWDSGYAACRTFGTTYNQTSITTSSMIYGCQWDQMCIFVKENGDSIGDAIYENRNPSHGNFGFNTFTYKDLNGDTQTKEVDEYIEIPTGSSDYTRINNIYDAEGNYYEWSQEAYEGYYYIRGSEYTEYRCGIEVRASYSDWYVSTRPTLYIN